VFSTKLRLAGSFPTSIVGVDLHQTLLPSPLGRRVSPAPRCSFSSLFRHIFSVFPLCSPSHHLSYPFGRFAGSLTWETQRAREGLFRGGILSLWFFFFHIAGVNFSGVVAWLSFSASFCVSDSVLYSGTGPSPLGAFSHGPILGSYFTASVRGARTIPPVEIFTLSPFPPVPPLRKGISQLSSAWPATGSLH